MIANTCEYIIKQKLEGKALAKRIGFIAAYVLIFSFMIMVTFLYLPKDLYLIIIPLIFAFTALLIFITWRFTYVEYEVSIAGGDITVTLIYGKGSPTKRLLNVAVNAITEIGEYDEQAYDEISKLSLQKNFICISSLSAPSIYYAIFEEEQDRCILYFDATDEAVTLLKRLNSSAFRASDKRMNKN